MAGYLGSVPVPQATQHRETFTCTEGQTTFNTAGYTPQFVDVYLNGSHLSPADFTASNGSDVVLGVAASADDVCDIVSYTPFEVANQTFTGTTTMTDVVAASLDISGNIDIDGTTNLDAVDIDGAVDMASTLGVAGVVTANAGVVVDNFTLDGTSLSLSSGVMTINAADVRIKNVANDETMAQFDDDGAVNLYNNNEISLSTVAGGSVSIYNDLSLTSDGAIINIGAGNDLKISHTGSAATINNDTGDLSIQSDGNLKLERKDGGEDYIHCIADGAVELHHNGTKKFETLAEGSQSQNDHSATDLATQSDNSTFRLLNSSVGNNIFNALEFASNQESAFITLVNHGTQSSRKLSFYIGSTGGDAASDNKLDIHDGGVDFNPAAGNKDFRVRSENNDQMLFVDASADKVGIGLTAPNEMLEVRAANAAIRVSGGNSSANRVQIGYDDSNGPYVQAGSSGIATLQFYVDSTSLAMTIAANDVISGDFNDTSDVALKENITDLESATTKLKQLKPRTFDWKKTNKENGVAGFIAQEVETVIPKAVVGTNYENSGDAGKAVNTTALLAYAIKTIQELEARIAILEG